MSNLPIPGFETLQKLQGWAALQSGTLLTILGDGPTAFLKRLRGSAEEQLAEAVKFLAFIILLCSLITLPLTYAVWHVDVTNLAVVLTVWAMNTVTVLVFCSGIHLTARTLWSKTDFKRGLAAMFFTTAYMPFLFLTAYLDRVDPIGREILVGNTPPEDVLLAIVTRPMLIIAVMVQAIVISYILYKLVGVVRVTYAFGRPRAVLTVCTVGIVFAFLQTYILIPIWGDFVKQAGHP